MDDLFTVREVAQKLRVDDTTVRRWVKGGLLTAITLPHPRNRKSYRVPRSSVEAIYQTGLIEPEPAH